jgi:hypothetical protein
MDYKVTNTGAGDVESLSAREIKEKLAEAVSALKLMAHHTSQRDLHVVREYNHIVVTHDALLFAFGTTKR